MELKQAFWILRHGSSDGLPRYLEAVKTIEKNTVPVVRCEDCVHWMPKHVKMNDGTIRFYETNEGIVTIEKGINVGSYCKRFDDVTVHGYRDGEPCIDKTKAWCNQDDFCSYGERKNNGNENCP